MKRVSKKWSKNGSFRVSRGPRNPQKLTFWRQNIKFGILGCPKMTHFWPKSGPKMGHFLDPFFVIFDPFSRWRVIFSGSRNGSEVGQKWGQKWVILGYPRGVQKWPFWENWDFIICLRAILSIFVTFFVSNLAILQYFAQVATWGFWPKIDQFYTKKVTQKCRRDKTKFLGSSRFCHFWHP